MQDRSLYPLWGGRRFTSRVNRCFLRSRSVVHVELILFSLTFCRLSRFPGGLDAIYSQPASSSRFLCLGDFLFGVSSLREGGGKPNLSRACRLTSLEARNVLAFRRRGVLIA